jgi:glycosyltransferase involved in cell wall biosynthesis
MADGSAADARSTECRGEAPLVSVIMIFLNGEKFIQEAIESVLTQNYPSWELLLVDDGSTDASTAVARQYVEHYPDRIRYLEHTDHANRGMSASRNLGIRHARGTYIALLDADDVWLSPKLERQIALLRSHPEAAMVYGSPQCWKGWTGRAEDLAEDEVPPLGTQVDTVFRAPELATLLYPLGEAPAPCPSDLLLRREAVERVGGFEECFPGFYEDQAFLIKVYLRENVFVSSESWLRYRVHPESCCSVTMRNGQYHPVRRFFLNWLGVYLHTNGVADTDVWNAFGRALEASGRQLREGKWSLRLAEGSLATLTFPADPPESVRIAIEKAATDTSFDIQLNLQHLAVKANQRYRVEFQARADEPRRLCVGIAEAQAPWTGLGWYQELSLTSQWQSFGEAFVATRDAESARIHFDLGNSAIPVELNAVRLRQSADDQFVGPQ